MPDPCSRPAAGSRIAVAVAAMGAALSVVGGAMAQTDAVGWLRAPILSGCSGHAMAYDSVRQRIVMHGGDTSFANTWEWDGTNWLLQSSLNAPPPRARSTMAFDTAHQRIVLFGGMSPCLLGLAGTTQNVSLGGGCTSYLLDPVFAFAITTQNGIVSLRTAIPWNSAMRGAQLDAQAVVLDPQGPALGLQFTGALVLTIGD